MMEQSTQTNNIIVRPKKKKGIPTGTALYTEEEANERARQSARLYHSLNFEKERERTRMEYHAKKEMLFKVLFLYFLFVNFHLNNWQSNYIMGD